MAAAFGMMAAGFVVLTLGGELLVRGASRLAALAGISPLVIGLTVVAFGTSAPELAVSLKAAYAGQTDLAVGNIVGSCIFNVLFILGLSALLSPLVVSSQLVRLDVPLMIAASVAALLMGLDGVVGRLDGLLLFGALICYVGWSVRKSRTETASVRREFKHEFGSERPRSTVQALAQLALIVAGLVLLTSGARWLVAGASDVARALGMSELTIGLTIVAVGTSLPEVATSVMASLRGERDIAVGNVVGSNIFNIMCVLGLSAACSPAGVAVSGSALRLDMPVMIAAAVACLPIFYTGHVINRWEGGLFFGYYCVYAAHLFLAATTPALGRSFGMIIVVFVAPLTVLTLGIGVYRTMRASRIVDSNSPPAEPDE